MNSMAISLPRGMPFLVSIQLCLRRCRTRINDICALSDPPETGGGDVESGCDAALARSNELDEVSDLRHHRDLRFDAIESLREIHVTLEQRAI